MKITKQRRLGLFNTMMMAHTRCSYADVCEHLHGTHSYGIHSHTLICSSAVYLLKGSHLTNQLLRILATAATTSVRKTDTQMRTELNPVCVSISLFFTIILSANISFESMTTRMPMLFNPNILSISLLSLSLVLSAIA